MRIAERQQREETSPLDRRGKLPLVSRFSTRDSAGHDFSCLGNELSQGIQIFVIDLFDALGGESAKFSALELTDHVLFLYG